MQQFDDHEMKEVPHSFPNWNIAAMRLGHSTRTYWLRPALVFYRCAGRLEQSSSGDQMHRRAFHFQAPSEGWAVLASLRRFSWRFWRLDRDSLTLNGLGFAFAVIRFYFWFTVFLFLYCRLLHCEALPPIFCRGSTQIFADRVTWIFSSWVLSLSAWAAACDPWLSLPSTRMRICLTSSRRTSYERSMSSSFRRRIFT